MERNVFQQLLQAVFNIGQFFSLATRYLFDIKYKSTQQIGRICVVQNVHEQQIQDLPLKASDMAWETTKDPIEISEISHTQWLA